MKWNELTILGKLVSATIIAFIAIFFVIGLIVSYQGAFNDKILMNAEDRGLLLIEELEAHPDNTVSFLYNNTAYVSFKTECKPNTAIDIKYDCEAK